MILETMSDTQVVTIAIAIIFPLSMLLLSNTRITDTKETLRAEIGESKQALRLDMSDLRKEMALGFGRIDNQIERLGNKIDHVAGEVATLKEMFSTHLREHHGIK